MAPGNDRSTLFARADDRLNTDAWHAVAGGKSRRAQEPRPHRGKTAGIPRSRAMAILAMVTMAISSVASSQDLHQSQLLALQGPIHGTAVQLMKGADVSVTVALSPPGQYFTGEPIRITIVVHNAGASTATKIRINDTLTNMAVMGVSGACAELPCIIGALSAGSSTTISLQTQIGSPGMAGIEVSANAEEPDFNPSNNAKHIAINAASSGAWKKGELAPQYDKAYKEARTPLDEVQMALPAPTPGAHAAPPPPPPPPPAPAPEEKGAPPTPPAAVQPDAVSAEPPPASVPQSVLPSPASDPFAAVDQLLQEMPSGNIAFNVPDSMSLKDTATIDLKLSLSSSIDQLKQSIQAIGDKQGAPIRVSDVMEARLTGADFAITAITPERQAVSASQDTDWSWDIQPTKSGTQHLHLTLSAVFKLQGEEVEREVKTFDKDISIKVSVIDAIEDFIKHNWQWLWATIVIPVVGWGWQRRRSGQTK